MFYVRRWTPIFPGTSTELHFFFFNDTATTEIYTLSLHDALPICVHCLCSCAFFFFSSLLIFLALVDRKSTRLNSSHRNISYAVFCLKKNKHIGIVACSAEGMSLSYWRLRRQWRA